jgi:hypothetical protein
MAPAPAVDMSTDMTRAVGQFVVSVERIAGYEFRARFDKEHFEELRLDEPPPLGMDSAPNAARLLAVSIGNCLASSLLFFLSKSKTTVHSITSEVRVERIVS